MPISYSAGEGNAPCRPEQVIPAGTKSPLEKQSHPGHASAWRVMGLCALLAALGTFIGDRALQEPRLPAQEADDGETPSIDPKSTGSLGMDFSEMMDTRRLTGTHAADFTLPDVQSGEPVSLKNFRGKPMVLIFGSYDCTVFCGEADKVERFYQAYKSRLPFLFVQIVAPGHLVRPLDALPEMSNLAGGERLGRARAVLRALRLTIPSVLDLEDQTVQKAYEAHPKRMVLVDANGIIAADSGRGMPNGWNLQSFEKELEPHLAGGGPAE